VSILDNIKILTGNQPVDPPPPQKPPKKVLIVEDEKALADTLVTAFQEVGFSAISAENGEEGLKMLVALKPNLLVLDILMPVMNGREMLHRLRDMEEFKRLPVIVLTNAGDVENVRDTQTFHDAAEFLIKSNVTVADIIEKARILTNIS